MNPIPTDDSVHPRRGATARRSQRAALWGAAVLMASAATLHAEMPDFNEPQDWTIHSKPGNPAGQDPLNVILSAQSDVSLEEVFAAMDGTVPAGYKLFCQAGGGESGSCDYVPVYWKPVAVVEATDQAGKVAAFFNGGCISPMFGQVQPTGAPKEQDLSYRAGGFDTCAQYDPPINHLRRYIQTIPGNNNQTAAFLAVSLEQACLLHEGAVVYHCIAPDGFNQGREAFFKNLQDVANLKGWWFNFRDIRRPAGTGSDGVAYDDLVRVVTIRKSGPPVIRREGSFEKVTGPACPQDGSKRFFTNPASGWGTETEGQWHGDGCIRGPYLWTWANGGGWEADWIFRPALDGLTSCFMQAWVPATHSAVSTAKAHYQIFDGDWNRVHEVWIDQAKIGNAWAGDGFRTDAFRVNNANEIRIVLTDENTGGALAVDAVKLGCHTVQPSGVQ